MERRGVSPLPCCPGGLALAPPRSSPALKLMKYCCWRWGPCPWDGQDLLQAPGTGRRAKRCEWEGRIRVSSTRLGRAFLGRRSIFVWISIASRLVACQSPSPDPRPAQPRQPSRRRFCSKFLGTASAKCRTTGLALPLQHRKSSDSRMADPGRTTASCSHRPSSVLRRPASGESVPKGVRPSSAVPNTCESTAQAAIQPRDARKAGSVRGVRSRKREASKRRGFERYIRLSRLGKRA